MAAPADSLEALVRDELRGPVAELVRLGVSLFALSRCMGTSLAMIDATYGHLAPDAEERERELLDAYDAAVAESSIRSTENPG